MAQRILYKRRETGVGLRDEDGVGGILGVDTIASKALVDAGGFSTSSRLEGVADNCDSFEVGDGFGDIKRSSAASLCDSELALLETDRRHALSHIGQSPESGII